MRTRIPNLATTRAFDRYMAGQRLVSGVETRVAAPHAALVSRTGAAELLDAPGLRDFTLMTLASGAEHLECKLHGRWESANVRVNDLWFVPPTPVSWRWQSIGDKPLSTVHVNIERALLDSVAQQIGLDASRELSLDDAMHFHDPLIAAMLAALQRAVRDPADSRLYVDMLVHARHASAAANAGGNAARRTGPCSPNGRCRAGFDG